MSKNIVQVISNINRFKNFIKSVNIAKGNYKDYNHIFIIDDSNIQNFLDVIEDNHTIKEYLLSINYTFTYKSDVIKTIKEYYPKLQSIYFDMMTVYYGANIKLLLPLFLHKLQIDKFLLLDDDILIQSFEDWNFWNFDYVVKIEDIAKYKCFPFYKEFNSQIFKIENSIDNNELLRLNSGTLLFTYNESYLNYLIQFYNSKFIKKDFIRNYLMLKNKDWRYWVIEQGFLAMFILSQNKNIETFKDIVKIVYGSDSFKQISESFKNSKIFHIVGGKQPDKTELTNIVLKEISK